MIRPINITLNAAHPELPLQEATTFTGSPSTVFIRGVPKSVGNWSITAVQVAVSYPDNSATSREAVESAEGVWVATIPGTTTSGRTEAGFRILASGIDENGAAVTGYVLGFADFSVFSFLPVPAPGETFYLLRYFDAMPTTPKKGDVTKIDDVLKFYNGTAWEPFANLTNYYTKAETNAALAEKASTADATLTPIYSDTPTFSEWTIKREGGDVTSQVQQPAYGNIAEGIYGWTCPVIAGDHPNSGYEGINESDALSLAWSTTLEYDESSPTFIYTATRTRTDIIGYTLGSQTDKPLQPKGDYPTKSEMDAAIDALAAYYITYNAQGANFPTRAALLNATAYYSGGALRVPTRNDYAVVLADETHSGAEWRYIYAVPDGSTTGQWEAQYPIETNDYAALSNKPSINNVTLSGNQTPAALGLQSALSDAQLANIAAVPGKANASDLRYSFNAATTQPSGTGVLMVTGLVDRAINYFTVPDELGYNGCNVTLPAATTGKVRDFYIRLIIQTGGAPTITFIDPATQAAITPNNVAFGASSLADIAPGDNLILFTEVEANKWLVSVKHEEAAS